jgi:hypothetical protein
MSSTERLAIPSPAVGLMVYDTVKHSFWCYAGSSWVEIRAGYVALLSDIDNDTRVTVDDGSDPDSIFFEVAGTEVMRLTNRTLEFVNNGESVFLGECAGENDDLSDNANTFVGYHSGRFNTTGFSNTALGYNSLLNNSTGERNTAIGQNALANNATGDRNTAIGYNALNSNYDGNRNTGVGLDANYYNQMGNDNTIIGYQAGHGNTYHSKSGNVFLGYRAGYNETGDNKLYIDNDSVSLPLVYGDFSSDSLSINGALNVEGAINIKSNTNDQQAGMIRWNDLTEDFEGYNGSSWKSFTILGGIWGNIKYSCNENSGVVASDGATDDFFGTSVSISGDYAVIGAYGKNSNQGKAFIFNRTDTGWVETDTITASDGTAGDFFGASVSISGDYAVIGAYGKNSDQGKAYIFHLTDTGWTETDTLIVPGGTTGDFFGWSVSISGDYTIIGAYGKESEKGKAYIFHRSGLNWNLKDTLEASDADLGDHFGYSVSMSEDYAIVGAPDNDNVGQSNVGRAYIFHRIDTNWVQEDYLVGPYHAGDRFGRSVSISGSFAIVAAPYVDFDGYQQGEV